MIEKMAGQVFECVVTTLPWSPSVSGRGGGMNASSGGPDGENAVVVIRP